MQKTHRDSKDFFVSGAYIGYEYKKFFSSFEWAQADGSNGFYGYSNKHYPVAGIDCCYIEITYDEIIGKVNH